MKTLLLPLIFLFITPTFSIAKELSCLPRSEIGETTYSGHFYERDDTLNPSNLSHMDFDQLTVTHVTGKITKIEKVEENVYKTVGSGTPYYYHKDNASSIVVELQVKDSAAYAKVLLCK